MHRRLPVHSACESALPSSVIDVVLVGLDGLHQLVAIANEPEVMYKLVGLYSGIERGTPAVDVERRGETTLRDVLLLDTGGLDGLVVRIEQEPALPGLANTCLFGVAEEEGVPPGVEDAADEPQGQQCRDEESDYHPEQSQPRNLHPRSYRQCDWEDDEQSADWNQLLEQHLPDEEPLLVRRRLLATPLLFQEQLCVVIRGHQFPNITKLAFAEFFW